jgi:hypothetical protein
MKKFEIVTNDIQEIILKTKAAPEEKKIYGELVSERRIIHLPSERSVGKTMFLLQLLHSISSYDAREFCGIPLHLHGSTLLVNYEIPERSLGPRIVKLFDSRKSNSKMKVMTGLGRTLKDSVKELETLLKEFKPLVVAIDSWQLAFADIDNNKAGDTASAVMQIRALAEEFDCAIIVADHLRKGTKYELTDSDLQSGSGVKSNFFDQDFFLRRSSQDKNLRLLTRSKYRYSAEEEGSTLIRLNPETLWFELVERNVDESEHLINPAILKAKNEVKQGTSIREAAKNNGLSKSALHRSIAS